VTARLVSILGVNLPYLPNLIEFKYYPLFVLCCILFDYLSAPDQYISAPKRIEIPNKGYIFGLESRIIPYFVIE